MIRVTFPDGTTADIPEETPCKLPIAKEVQPLSEARDDGEHFVRVERAGRWEYVTVESWEEEARRLRAERDAIQRHLALAVEQAISLRDAEHHRADAAEKKLAALRAWAEGQAWAEGLLLPATTWREVVARIDGKETP